MKKDKSPEYYQLSGGVNVMDIIRLWMDKYDTNIGNYASCHTAFLVGNILKYLFRFPYKGSSLSDLQKAKHYLELLIEAELPK